MHAPAETVEDHAEAGGEDDGDDCRARVGVSAFVRTIARVRRGSLWPMAEVYPAAAFDLFRVVEIASAKFDV